VPNDSCDSLCEVLRIDFERSKPSLDAHRDIFFNPNSDFAFVGAESYDEQRERDEPIDPTSEIYSTMPEEVKENFRNFLHPHPTYTKVLDTVSKSTPYDNQWRFHPTWLNGPKPTSTPAAYENRERNATVIWANVHGDSERSKLGRVEPLLSNGRPQDDFRRITDIGEAIDRLKGDVEVIFLPCCKSKENAEKLLEYEKVKRVVYFGNHNIRQDIHLEFIFKIIITHFEKSFAEFIP
jgi:hypothetical protein